MTEGKEKAEAIMKMLEQMLAKQIVIESVIKVVSDGLDDDHRSKIKERLESLESEHASAVEQTGQINDDILNSAKELRENLFPS